MLPSRIVCSTFRLSSPILISDRPRLLATHTDPSPTAIPVGALPTPSIWDAPPVGSTRDTASSPWCVTQTTPLSSTASWVAKERSVTDLTCSPVSGSNRVTRFDPDTGEQVRSVTLRSFATQLAVDDSGVVWVTHQGDDAVSRVDPTGGASQIEGVGNAPTGIAVGDGSVWVASSLGRSLIRIGLERRKVEQTIRLGSIPEGVVVASGHVWVTTGTSG